MNNLKDRAKVYLTQRRSRVSVSGISIGADWAMVVTLTAVALSAGAIYGYVLFNGVSSGSVFEAAEPEGAEDYAQKRSDIERAVERLGAN